MRYRHKFKREIRYKNQNVRRKLT